MKPINPGRKEFIDIGCADLSISVVKFNEDLASPWHYHEKSYFTYVQKGGNVERSRRESKECAAGMLLFYNSDDWHFNEKGQNRSLNFNIEIEHSWFKKHEIDRTHIAGITTLEDVSVKTSFLKLMTEAMLRDKFSRLAIEGYLLEIFARLLRLKTTTRMQDPKWVKTIHDFLSSDEASNATLDSLASLAGMHPVTLSREFPRYFGEGFADHIRNIRCSKAMQLLSKKNLALDEIATQAGFSDASHLINTFRKKFRVTPGQYRALL